MINLETKYLYLLVDFFCIIVPFIFSFHSKLKFNRHHKTFLISATIVAMIFLLWDIYFTHIGIWGFSEKYTLGFRLFSLPIEEILFFYFIPYCCIFSMYCFQVLNVFGFVRIKNISPKLILLFSVVSLIIALLNYHRAYTFSTFLVLSITLFLFKNIFSENFILIFFSYVFLLIPFYFSNGILTGAYTESPVVWYNNAENLTIRWGTIPLEDIFYGLDLYLLNVAAFNHFSSNLSPKKDSNLKEIND